MKAPFFDTPSAPLPNWTAQVTPFADIYFLLRLKYLSYSVFKFYAKLAKRFIKHRNGSLIATGWWSIRETSGCFTSLISYAHVTATQLSFTLKWNYWASEEDTRLLLFNLLRILWKKVVCDHRYKSQNPIFLNNAIKTNVHKL